MSTRMSSERHTVYIERRLADKEATRYRAENRRMSWAESGRL